MATPDGIADVIPEFADAFPFESFNEMQAAALPAVLDSDENVVVSAPTASGKTAIAELAICRTLHAGGTALFLAPMRSLTNQMEDDWERFEALGYSVYVVTGERDLNPRRAERADILVMTPEKADLATRKHDSPRYSFITDVDCCVIDEVHLLDSERRGAVLEVTVSRLRRLCDPRLVALSATMENVREVADWLDVPPECTVESEYRPVPLEKNVVRYTRGDNAFADKYRRLYRALDRAQPHVEDGGQALVFVSSRQDTVRAAEKARDEMADRDVDIAVGDDLDFHTDAQELRNQTLKELVTEGVGFHHAGLSKRDKDRVEEWFRSGEIQLLFSTSTLAWGVNLPARCVVIRDTKHHDPLEGEVDMSPLDILQMLGRAGRPGYDDAGYAYIVCEDTADAVEKYRTLIRDGKPIESRLADELDTHLNAEIALGVIDDVEDVMDWLETTFYYVRAHDQDGEGSIRDQDGEGSIRDQDGEDSIRERVSETLERLVDGGFVERSGVEIEPTALGQLTSQFYLELDTAEGFHALCKRAASDDTPDLEESEVLRTVADAAEFDSVAARRDEREAFGAVLAGEGDDLDPGNRKVLAILRAGMSGTTPGELQSDAWVIRQTSLRLLAALRAFCERFAAPRDANLVRRIEARVEDGVSGDAVGLTAIEGVGSGRAQKLAREGLASPADVRDAGIDGLVDAGLSDGVAERVLEQARSLPSLEFEWRDLPDSIPRGENAVAEVAVTNDGDGAPAGVRVTVNGVEMSAETRYLGASTVPVGVFGGDAAELTYTVEVAFSGLPIQSVSDSRTVRVE